MNNNIRLLVQECWTLYRVLKNSSMAEQEAYEGGEGGER